MSDLGESAVPFPRKNAEDCFGVLADPLGRLLNRRTVMKRMKNNDRGPKVWRGAASAQCKTDLPEWWFRVPSGEKELIRGVLGMLRSARNSPKPEVCRAARKWERRLVCFIKASLVNGCGRSR